MSRMGKSEYYRKQVKRYGGSISFSSKADYVPADQRQGYDESKIETLKPYKDHEWTGAPFQSRKGAKKL